MALAREVDARELLVHRDRDVGIGLVVAQPDVEARLVLLDEVLLGEQRLGLAGDEQELDASIASTISYAPRVTGLEKWLATRFLIDFALPT